MKQKISFFNKSNSLKDNFDNLLFKYYSFEKEKSTFLLFLEKGSKNGISLLELTENILESYEKTNPFFYRVLVDCLIDVDDNGISLIEGLFNSGILNENEYYILSKSVHTYEGLSFLREKNIKHNNLKSSVLLLFLPAILVSFLFFAFQPLMADFTNGLLEPIMSQTERSIELPVYLQDRTSFGILLFSLLGLVYSIFTLISYLSKNNIPYFFKISKISQREFIIDSFGIIINLLNSGLSFKKSVEILSKEKSPIYSSIYSEINNTMKEGHLGLYQVMSEYNVDNTTLGYLKISEKDNDIKSSLRIAVEYNEDKYNKTISRIKKWFPLIGEFIMVMIFLWPTIGIIMLTSIDVMNFNLYM
jgi:hypothetical protein